MRTTSACRSCGAPIRWCETEAGKTMPLDAVADPEGNVIVIEFRPKPLVRVYAKPEDVPADEPLRYRSHFATCPEADEWRKR